MIRRFGFVVVLVSALIVSACGRQVTPDKNGTGPGSGLPSGFMGFKFRVNQPFNFQNFSYVVVFNTSGDGSTPRANAVQTAYQGYSFAIIVSGVNGNVTATAWQFFRPSNSAAPLFQPIIVAPQNLQLTLNSNGQNTEFAILFNRLAVATQFVTPSPGPTATPTPTPTPTATPTTSPSGSPTASPTPTPPPGIATTWTFNYFVVQGAIGQGTPIGGYQIIDSLGANPTGATDATYTSPNLDTLTAFDTGPFYPQPGIHQGDPAAQIQSGDITSNP